MSSFTRFIIPALRLLAPTALVLLGVVVGWSLREMSLVEASYRQEAEQRPVQPIQGPSAMHHPSFDCNSFSGIIDEPLDTRIAKLSDLKDGENVALKVRVMNVYHAIMDTNWYHLCDEEGGRVLVAETRQVVPAGTDITIRGTLRQNAQIGRAYRFPLFIEEAAIDGAPPAQPPSGSATTL